MLGIRNDSLTFHIVSSLELAQILGTVGVQGYSHRQSLLHLYEVASGIVGRHQ